MAYELRTRLRLKLNFCYQSLNITNTIESIIQVPYLSSPESHINLIFLKALYLDFKVYIFLSLVLRLPHFDFKTNEGYHKKYYFLEKFKMPGSGNW